MGPSILIVDDDRAVLKLIKDILCREGYSAVGTHSADEAVRAIERQKVDVAIIDLRLPDSNGVSLFVHLRQMSVSLRGILLTGQGAPEVAFQCGRVGMAAYLEKPVRTSVLLSAIAAALPTSVAHSGVATPHPADKVAVAVVHLARQAADIRTLAEWGRSIGASRGALRGWCHTCNVPPKNALALGRALRVYLISRDSTTLPSDLLDFADLRSLRKFLERGGFTFAQRPSASSVQEFCATQRYTGHPVLLKRVSALLEAR